VLETDEEQPVAGAPLVSIPGGTRWVKVTNPHPGQVVKVRKTNDLSVFYSQEKPGQSQGRVNGQHRADRQSFLRDYEPYAKRDWVAAQRVLASLEHEHEEVVEEQTVSQVDLERLNADTGFTTPVLPEITVELDQSEQPTFELVEAEPVSEEVDEIATAALLSPEQGEREVEAEPVSEPEPQPEEKPAPRRTKTGEINQTEQEEIVELWRAEQSVDEIARTYNATTQNIYNVLDEQVHDEYALWRVVELVKRDGGGPIKAYKVSQWMHIPKDGVRVLCTSEAAQKVLRYELMQRDPKRPWVETPMITLVTESEPEMATKATVNVAPEAVNGVAEAPTEEAAPRKRQWQVQLLTIVNVTVEASNLLDAHQVAMTTYPDTTEVVGVTEKR